MIVTIPPAEAGRKSTYRTLIDRNGDMTKMEFTFTRSYSRIRRTEASIPASRPREPPAANPKPSC